VLIEKRSSGQLQRDMEEQLEMTSEDAERMALPFDAFGAVVDTLQHTLFPLQDIPNQVLLPL
jgi:hypothetical protein